MTQSASEPSLLAALEAMLFVAGESADIAELARALGVSTAATRALVERLGECYAGRGLRVQHVRDQVHFITAPEVGPYVERFLGARQEPKLSRAALETLAIIAYRQPVTRAELERVRGVNCDGALTTLRERGLVEEVGRAEAVGRPVLFGTTARFLQHFGLEHPADLPPLPDLNEQR